MKTIRQLLRQPLKTLLGVILMTLAVAVLSVCIGQAMAAQSTKDALNNRFSTVAVPSLQEDYTGVDRILVDEELIDWLEKLAQEHPEIVKSIAPNGLLSAYIPEMEPYTLLGDGDPKKLNTSSFNRMFYPDFTGVTHYDSAVLVINLESVGTIIPHFTDIQDPLQKLHTYGYQVEIIGTVKQVLYVPEGFNDPIGMTARLTITLSTMEEIEALHLEPGKDYIVSGMDYFDDYQYLVAMMKTTKYKHVSFAPFDPKLLRVPTEDEIRRFRQNMGINVYMIYNNAPLTKDQYERFNTISMNLCTPETLLEHTPVFDNLFGYVKDWIKPTEANYQDRWGKTHTLSLEEFKSLYTIPMIAEIDGDVEAFLQSDAGSQWSAALERAKVNGHAFSVVGVEDLHQLPTFSLGKSTIGEGREFTTEDVETGAKVCIIHEWLAEKNGLKIGDTITLGFYGTDDAIPYKQDLYEGYGLLRPSANLYYTTTPITETAEYTIVGFWQGVLWPNMVENYYSFSVNTVFVPGTSVQTDVEYLTSLPFVSVLLENGTIEQFHNYAKRSGFAGQFKYNDQGYSEIAVNFHNYEALAQQILLIGISLYGILLLLFLLLYPATQRKTVRIMQSMGCHFGKRFFHVLVASMTMLLIATALGGYFGTILWDRMVVILQETTESSIALELDVKVLKQVAGAQLVLAFGLSAVIAFFMALPRGISARR